MHPYLGGDYPLIGGAMFSAQGDAVSRLLKIATSPTGRRYLYNDDLPDAGAYIYVEDGPNSDGFGGATIPFRLVDGSTLSLKGPWHTNSYDLYRNTGIDLRRRHLTWGCIGLDRAHVNSGTVVKSLIVIDPPSGLEGPFNRIEDQANALARTMRQELCYYFKSRSGSSCGFTRAL